MNYKAVYVTIYVSIELFISVMWILFGTSDKRTVGNLISCPNDKTLDRRKIKMICFKCLIWMSYPLLNIIRKVI